MPLVPATYAGLILQNSGLIGPQAPQLATGLAVGITTYILTFPTPVIASVDAGAPGAGAGAGVLNPASCPPPALQGLLEANLRGLGLLGPSITQLTFGLSVATCTYLASGATVTAHAAVGVGTGVGKFVGLEPVGMAAAITAATGFAGVQWPQMVSGISIGMCTFLLANPIFNIAIAGAAGPGAATGVGTGKIL